MRLKIAGDAVYLSDKNVFFLSSIMECLQYMSSCCKGKTPEKMQLIENNEKH